MPHAVAGDGTRIGFEERGVGEPVVFVHEFGGEPASWAHQVDAMADRYRCVAYAARGFHPSDVPGELAAYGQYQATEDLAAVFNHAGIDAAHIAGTSMGSFTCLDFALAYPDRVLSLTLVGNSSGPRDERERQRYRSEWIEREIGLREELGGSGAVKVLEADPAYASFQRNLPDEWQAYAARLARQSVAGAVAILKTLHWHRRSLWEDVDRLRSLQCPVLLAHGDEDYFLVDDTNAFLESVLPRVERVVFEHTGHLANIERADGFNARLANHLSAATRRSPRG